MDQILESKLSLLCSFLPQVHEYYLPEALESALTSAYKKNFNSKTNVKLLINRVPDILFFGIPKVIDRFIDSNKNLTYENINKTFKNVVSIYVRNEIKAGNIPYEICFACGSDWKNHTQESLKELLEKTKSKEKTKEKISEKSKLYKFLHLYWLRGKNNGKISRKEKVL